MASIPFEMSREEADREFDRPFPDRPQGAVRRLTQDGFDDALGKALRLCRLAADLRLPIAEMLEHVEEAYGAVVALNQSEDGRETLVPGRASLDELEALREIIAAVADVAAIGANLGNEGALPPPDRPQTAPLSPSERSFPLPANLREA